MEGLEIMICDNLFNITQVKPNYLLIVKFYNSFLNLESYFEF